MSAQPTPENCPEPFWHETHYYCPRCSWRSPDAPISMEVRLRAENERLRSSLTAIWGLAKLHEADWHRNRAFHDAVCIARAAVTSPRHALSPPVSEEPEG